MKFILVAFAILFVSASSSASNIKCMCNILVKDVPANKNNTILDAFKNELKIATCDEKGLEECKKFCINNEKEKTNGDLSKESKVSKTSYGQLLCTRLGFPVEKKSVGMESQIQCLNNTMKKVDTGILLKNQLTCKDGKFVKA